MALISIWFCTLTNFVAVIPTVMFYKRNMVQDSILGLASGLSSFLYHGNNSDPSIFKNILSSSGIRNADVILAYLLAFHTSHIAIFKNQHTRWKLTTAVLPLAIYFPQMNPFISYIIMITYGSIGILSALYNRSKYYTKWVIIGTIVIILDIIFTWLGEIPYHEYYYILHGCHHITCYATVAAFIKSNDKIERRQSSPKIEYSTQLREWQTLDSLNESDNTYEEPKTKHRRHSSNTIQYL